MIFTDPDPAFEVVPDPALEVVPNPDFYIFTYHTYILSSLAVKNKDFTV
jgi:hypothetical protein